MAMTYTEALAMSRQTNSGLEKTAAPIPAMEGWQRAALGGLGGGLLTGGLASLLNPGASTRAKILLSLLGTGAGAAAGYRFLPGYNAEQATSKEPADKGEDGGDAQAAGAGAAAAAADGAAAGATAGGDAPAAGGPSAPAGEGQSEPKGDDGVGLVGWLTGGGAALGAGEAGRRLWKRHKQRQSSVSDSNDTAAAASETPKDMTPATRQRRPRQGQLYEAGPIKDITPEMRRQLLGAVAASNNVTPEMRQRLLQPTALVPVAASNNVTPEMRQRLLQPTALVPVGNPRWLNAQQTLRDGARGIGPSPNVRQIGPGASFKAKQIAKRLGLGAGVAGALGGLGYAAYNALND